VRITIFNTPVLAQIFQVLSILVLGLFGWRAVGKVPKDIRKYVIIAAPHTSYWDFPMFLLVVFALRLNLNVFIKHTLFIGPIGWFLSYCGGVPIDRRAAGARVRQTVQEFENNDDMVLLITPEGTRSAQTNWKTGFYHIASEANVPVAVAFVDTAARRAGIDHFITPSGDIDKQMAEIKAFYDTKRGVKPQNYAS
jgi:1-acyl-sn-glycerol-3-phosphate acyltransferase|tara:strand:- start:94 stop:678 length:585 start_codon:yes stop_codon:yes gene_type:complete